MIDPKAQDDPLDQAFAAYLRSCDEGLVGSREEFLAQFPELADELKQLIEAADLMDQFTSDPSSTATLPGAETVDAHVGGGESGGDPAATLPMANRPEGDPGPTLPFDLGDYQLLEIIGRGGMGVVYLAKQNHLDRMVAVKMIRSGMLADESEVRRFYTEAQAAARLRHPGIVAVYQFGHLAGHHFYSMEFVRGTDLQRKINSATLEPKLAARYVRDVARAIDHAHQNGVLHRDLKPANVLIDGQDRVHVTDFGLAKHMDADSSVTGSGAAVGTPHYMAPEQASGNSDRVNTKSDVYALGAILFAAITGRPPLVGDSVVDTLLKVVHDVPPPMRTIRPDTPTDLETIVAKCLEKKPGNRYESAARLADELDAFLEDRPIDARPRSAAVKAWHWVEEVPVVAAISGRRVFRSSDTHRRVQAGLLMMLVLVPILLLAAMTVTHRLRQSMPQQVYIAGGTAGGIYNDLSDEISRRLTRSQDVDVVVTRTNGSMDNRARLLAGDIHLAPMEASAIRGGNLCVVAPLFYEAVHVLAREDSGIRTMDDLSGHRVAVGPSGSGSRATAEYVFESLGMAADAFTREEIEWPDLYRDDAPDAAVICIGCNSPLVSELLVNRRWTLISIPNCVDIALRHPTLRPMTIEQGDYQDFAIPDAGINTVGTTAFLATRLDAPAALIEATLDAIYAEPELTVGMIPRDRAAEWQGLAFHPVARNYFLPHQ
tara:strand:+ start:355713 stop:357857 length:2145 start_codon:yes stop_codon:yes gene_type:complete